MTVRNIRKARRLLSAAGPLPALGLTLALGLAQAPAQAQQAGDFQLPTASPSPSAPPRVQGPVDADNPVAAPRAQPTPSEAPAAAAPAPVVTAPVGIASAAPSPTPSPIATRRVTPPRVQATTLPTTANPAAPTETASLSTEAASPTSAPLPTPTQTAAAAPAATAPAGEVPWVWFGGGALLAALGCAFMLSRRKPAMADDAADADAPADEIPVAASPLAEVPIAPLAARLPEPVIEPAPAPAPVTMPEPAFTAAPSPLVAVTLEPTRLSATLVNTALDYRVTLTNTGDEAAESLVIAADMVGAQSGLPAEAQVATAQLSLPERHRVAALAAGESVTLSGSIRLPLADITPIRQGEARLFVPLVRMRLSAGNDVDAPVSQLYTWVIGGSADTPEARLRPFRLDLGPRIFTEVSHRLL